MSCVTPPPPPKPPAESADAAPRAALEQFLAAEKAGDFPGVYRLLSSNLRARYTPDCLQSDFLRDEDLAQDKLTRIRATLGSGASLEIDGPGAAHLTLAANRAVRLVREPDGWHVASLE